MSSKVRVVNCIVVFMLRDIVLKIGNKLLLETGKYFMSELTFSLVFWFFLEGRF
jgi:hypothetical protein